MFNVSIFGGGRVDGSTLDPGERVISLCLFGGVEMDFATYPPPPGVEVVLINIFGGANLKVRPEQVVKVSGLSLFGARHVEPIRELPSPSSMVVESEDDDGLLEPLEIMAYTLFGAVTVRRTGAVIE